MLFVVLVMRSVHADYLLGSAVKLFDGTLPAASASLLQDQIEAEVASRVPEGWVLGVLLAAGALWACSAGFRAVATALNVMYDTHSQRRTITDVAISIVFALVTASVWLMAFVLVQLISARASTLGLTRWTIARVVSQLLGAFLVCAAVYAVVPYDRRAFRAIIPGAVCAAVAWMVFSLVFDFILDEFGQFLVDPLYGWFTGLFALLLYLYWSSFMLLLGAEVNCAIERGASLSTRQCPSPSESASSRTPSPAIRRE